MRVKTYEILKRIDKKEEDMIGKRFRQVGGLYNEEFGIGDIAIVTKYHGITSLGAEKFSKIRIALNGFEEWEEIKQPVDFLTAVGSGRRIKVEHELVQECSYYLLNEFCNMDEVMKDLENYIDDDIRDIIVNGKWYVEN